MRNSGIVSLAVILVITLFLFAIGILLGIQGGTLIFSGFSAKQVEIAQSLAEAGIQDATLKLARNKGYEQTYTINQNQTGDADSIIDVYVSANVGNQVTIVATSTVTKALGTFKRAIKAVITLSSDGQGQIIGISKTNQ